MYQMFLRKCILPGGVIVFLSCLLLTACTTSDTSSSTGSSGVTSSSGAKGYATPTQPALEQGTSLPSTGSPGVGPTVIDTPTRVPGGSAQSQLVTLSDRILTISSVSKQAGNDASSVAISLTMTITNTSAKAIMNQATYFELAGAEGDAFGIQSSASSNFFGAIAPQSARSGTIIFQVPIGATNGLRLLYRPEIETEAVSVPLNLP